MKGPYLKSAYLGPYPYTKQWRRYWYRTSDGQKTRTPLPYDFRSAERVTPMYSTLSAIPLANVQGYVLPSSDSTAQKLYSRVYNKAYAKWVDKLKNGVQLGTDVAEGKQTIDMIASALRALRKPMDALRKAARDPSKAISGGYLAYHFGVEPLYKEIYALLELLEKGIRKRRVITAQATGTQTVLWSGTGETHRRELKCIVRHTAGVQVVDENLFSLNALGLLNPLAIAWELVPYSFVVDWLYPVGLYLQSLDTTLGVTLENPYTTTLFTCMLHGERHYPIVYNSDPGAFKPQVIKAFYMDRSVGTPHPVLQSTLNPWSTSLTRAMTAISLLVQAR